MRRILCIFFSLACITVLSLSVYAHPGRTDANGGHYDRSTGEYHYHHGYPAHQHINGTCPYDFDDRTGWNSGSSYGSSGLSDSRSNSEATASSASKSDSSGSSKGTSVSPLLLCLGAIMLVRLLHGFYKRQKLRAQKALEEKQRKGAFLAEQEKIRNLYEGKKLSELVPPPSPGDHIGPDGLPRGQGSEPWGSAYTVFVTSSKSRVFHRQKFCSCTMGRPVNIAKVGGLRPCSRCYRMTPPDLTWYRKQKEILRICKTYGISLAPEDRINN